ncbi:MAG: ParB N-terminal domain-containing protein [Clostridia bacterium]|nr:ParB N-terminal domain-containing protein [Clostridia bacterium]
MEYRGTGASAREFARYGQLEDWIHAYLTTDGRNKPFSDGLKLLPRHYIGPISMPLSLFPRICGPEDCMKYRVDEAGFEARVTGIMQAMENGADLPPMIVHYVVENGVPAFELTDGNHRHEACVRLGLERFDVVVWITEDTEAERFLRDFGEYIT